MPSVRSPLILILGAKGGLGRALYRHFAPNYTTVIWGRVELDFEQPEALVDKLAAQPFDLLLNAAGMTSPDVCEIQPEAAIVANVIAPQIIAECCETRGAHMIHFSTDYVFSGEPHEPWTEEDSTQPISVDGRTKREGELAVLQASPRALVARVSWLFGPDKTNHPDNIIQRAIQTADLSAVDDKVSVPTSNADICGWVELLMHADASGVWHLCNSGSASWHSWAEAALQIASVIGLPVKTTKVKPIKLTEITQLKAKRPLMTVMDNSKLQSLIGGEVRHWREALEDYLIKKYSVQ